MAKLPKKTTTTTSWGRKTKKSFHFHICCCPLFEKARGSEIIKRQNCGKLLPHRCWHLFGSCTATFFFNHPPSRNEFIMYARSVCAISSFVGKSSTNKNKRKRFKCFGGKFWWIKEVILGFSGKRHSKENFPLECVFATELNWIDRTWNFFKQGFVPKSFWVLWKAVQI